MMERMIALLRGINLGARNKILMADLRVLFQSLGYCDIKTYIQTGNVVFRSEVHEKTDEIGKCIEDKILSQCNFDVPVVIRTANEIKELVDNNPFESKYGKDKERYHMTLLSHALDANLVEKIREYDPNNDEFIIKGKDIYIYCSGHYMETKFGNNFFEKKLKVKATTRNWKTILKLLELSEG